MPVPLCQHVLSNGLTCRAIALSRRSFCHFHDRSHKRHTALRQTTPTPPPQLAIPLTPIEDRESVQLALSLVLNALAAGRLETRRATALLYGLQLAASVLPPLPAGPPRTVPEFPPL